MTLYKITDMTDGSTIIVQSRQDIKKAIGTCENTATKIMQRLQNNSIAMAKRRWLIQPVEVDNTVLNMAIKSGL